MTSVQRAFAHKLSKQHAADVRRQIANSASYSRDLAKSAAVFSGFSSTVTFCQNVSYASKTIKNQAEISLFLKFYVHYFADIFMRDCGSC